MSTTHEQRSARRKFIYFGVILLLFTGSLLHRKLVIAGQADQLLLRDTSRGKADLTDAALRHTLSGVRGVAVTSLWLAAIEKQKRHEWNELEVIVDSLTHLQPRFVSPWLYQGWNLAYNVSYECDRVRDKYYYVTRGINLLCRGEEKNDPGQADPPRPWPANPKMRFEIGFTYQRKIGLDDHHQTLRCLFDLSCIPPSQRQPEQFYLAGKQIDLEKFKVFCENNTRLVRRLRERLRLQTPEAIVKFLADNNEIPGRIEDRSGLTADKRLAEFPILPPQNPKAAQAYPDWRSEPLATNLEDFDGFACARAWYTYSQIPLPDPDEQFDRLKHRWSPFTPVLFRAYPAHGQAYVAEELQKDGWFDDSGWRISGWFDKPGGGSPLTAGSGQRYHSGEAWNKAHEYYRHYGLRNDLYLEPQDLKRLKEAERLDPASAGARKLALYNENRQMAATFDDHFYKSKVERTADAVAARKAIYELDKADPNVVNVYRDKVMPQWLDLLLRNPEFRELRLIQEDTYQLQADYFYNLQHYNKSLAEKVVIGAAYAVPALPLQGGWLPLADPNIARTLQYWHGTGELPGAMPPLTDLEGKFNAAWPKGVLKQAADKKGIKVLRLKDVQGPFDQLFVLQGPNAEAIKPVAVLLARLALWPPPPADAKAPDFALARFVAWPPVGPRAEIGLGGKAVWPPAKKYLHAETVATLAGAALSAGWPAPTFLMLNSAEDRRILTTLSSLRQLPPGQGWTPLISLEVIIQTRQSIGWMANPPGK